MPNNNEEFKNDWTIMFFFASDNPLAPLMVSQLKAIKDAGFQEHTEVLVYFDPMEKGCPTKIYNVNCQRKAYALEKWQQDKTKTYPKSLIGDKNDSYVRKMDGDEVSSANFSAEMKAAMDSPSTAPADKMLEYFVDYGMKHHRARNYMLILVGHGLMVGRDMFLPDDDPVSSISLKRLQEIMTRFKESPQTRLQLLCLHSCSMSSLEVNYQLRGTAKYVMAHQGSAFANSWPYRQFLKKTLNTIERVKRRAGEQARRDGEERVRQNEEQSQRLTEEQLEELVKDKQVDVQMLVEKLYYHCLFNATDFLSQGYSADLALCSLEEDKIARIKEPLQQLVRRLKANLDPPSPIMDLILLAHWESQSFWDENHTDLYDFCFCLRRKCRAMRSILPNSDLVNELGEVEKVCDKVIEVLSVRSSPIRSERFDGLVIHADNFGTKSQYSHGLSVYFPWCEPLDDDAPREQEKRGQPRPEKETKPRHQKIIEKYMDYDFNDDLGDDSWWTFLKLYFEQTKRRSRIKEAEESDGKSFEELHEINRAGMNAPGVNPGINRLMEAAATAFNSDGTLSHRTPEVGTRTPETGGICTCPTIKNYPTGPDKNYPARKVKEFSATPGALRAFRPERELEKEESLNGHGSEDE